MKIFLGLLVSVFFCNYTSAQEVVQGTNPQDTQQVKVKDKKGAENVYNFHFYHGKPEEKKPEVKVEEKKTEVKAEEPKKEEPVPLALPPKRGNGVEFGFYGMDISSKMDEVAELEFDGGFRIGYTFMNDSGSYVTPGLITMDVEAKQPDDDFMMVDRDYDGDSAGFTLKLGKLHKQTKNFAINTGIDFHYLSGELETKDNFFGEGTYEFTSIGAALYAGPVWQIGNFLLEGTLGMGMTNLNIKEELTEDDGMGGISETYKKNLTKPYIALALNVAYLF